jgi:hypothetical protein
MAYVAVSGGQEAIEESIRLLHCMRGSTFKELEVEAIEKKLGLLVDRVMSAGLCGTGFETGGRQYRRSSVFAAGLSFDFEPQLLYPAGQRDRDARCPQDLGSL